MSAPESDQPLGLKAKLLLIRRGMKHIPKLGIHGQGYKYVRAEDAVGKAQRLLARYDVLLLPAVDGPPIISGITTYVPMSYRFEDVETGEGLTFPWLGAGADKGDKGVYKAYTGALKFFLIQFFQVQVGDAPEPETTDEDGNSTKPAPATTVGKDAGRPAAPHIPRDRAKSILDAAVAAGLVTLDGETPNFSPVLKAHLSLVGVSKLGQLNVDQAESVERFIADEAKG